MLKQRRQLVDGPSAATKAFTLVGALLASAYLMSVARQSPDTGLWVGWFTLIPLFLSIRLLTPFRAFWAGAFWGVCFYLFSANVAAASLSTTAAKLFLLAGTLGAYTSIGAALTRRVGFSPLLLGLGWIGVEFALQPLHLRHGLLAGTQGAGLIVRTMGYVAGYLVVAFIVAYVNASLLSMLSEVCVVAGGTRMAPRAAGSENQLVPIELPTHFPHLLNPSHPRAPPM